MADTKTPITVTVQALAASLDVKTGVAPDGLRFPPWSEALEQYCANQRCSYARRIVWATEEYNAKIEKAAAALARSHKELIEHMLAIDKVEKNGVVTIAYDPKGVRILNTAEQRDIYETLRAAKPDFYYLQCLEHLVDVAQIRGIYAEGGVALPAWFTARYGAPEPAAAPTG